MKPGEKQEEEQQQQRLGLLSTLYNVDTDLDTGSGSWNTFKDALWIDL